MKVVFSDLGPINKAELTLGEMTVICGRNNTGKTYLTHAIYGLMNSWIDFLDFEFSDKVVEFRKQGLIKLDLEDYERQVGHVVKKISSGYSKTLPKVFNAEEDYFSKSKIDLEIDNYKENYISAKISAVVRLQKKAYIKAEKKRESKELVITSVNEHGTVPDDVVKFLINKLLGNCLLDQFFRTAFITTSERTGISLFYKELDINRNLLIDQLMNLNKSNKIEPVKLLDNKISRYSIAIKDNILFTRDYEEISKKEGEFAKNNPLILSRFEDLLGGNYKLKNKGIWYVMKQNSKEIRVPTYLGSSLVRSLIDLYFYLKFKAKKGNILFIDEPELNLHPDNQRILARLLAQIVNKGIRVFVTTHSDYFLKELNCLMMLSRDFKGKSKFIKKYGYYSEEIINGSKVKAYIAQNGTLESMKVNSRGCFEAKTFDDVINNMNDAFDNLYLMFD